MSDSETSITNNNILYQNSKGENILDNKKLTTDTDFYYNMIANPTKIIAKDATSESSNYNNIIITEHNNKSSNSSKSYSSKSNSNKSNSSKIRSENLKNITESKPIFEKINIPPINNRSNIQKDEPYNRPNIHQEQHYNNLYSDKFKNGSQQNINNNEYNLNTEPKLTPQDIRMKKIELLRKLCEIKTKGFNLSKEYDFNSSIEEMQYEYDLLKSFVDKRNGVKIFKNGLLQAVSVIEFLNDKYDPFDFHLSGWGEHMSVEVDSWEDVLEEIYEKYKGTGRQMAPEIKLLFLIIASASAFHFSKSYASKIPGLDTLLTSNPGLLSKIINPKKQNSQFMSPQEIHIQNQKNELNKKEQLQKQNINGLKNQQNEIRNFNNIPIASNDKFNHNITVPDNVKNILNKIHNQKQLDHDPFIKHNLDTQEELSSNNDRLLSETTITVSDNNQKKKPQPKKLKKSNLQVF